MIVIGIDESYTCTGVALVEDNKVLKYKKIDFKGCKNKSQKRKRLNRFLNKILKDLVEVKMKPSSDIIIICERIRTFSQRGLAPNYLKATGALIATIVDVAYEYDIPVYSVDTRSWKSQVVGTSKGDKDGDRKMPTIEFVKKLGIDVSYEHMNKKTKEVEIRYDDDVADAICIALYGFLPEDRKKLNKEE